MKTYLFLLLFVFQAFSLSSQISLKGYNQEKIDPSLFEGRWKARWISYPGEAPNVYGVYHFVNRSIWRWFLPGLSSMFPPITGINYM
mgnify:FL=1